MRQWEKEKKNRQQQGSHSVTSAQMQEYRKHNELRRENHRLNLLRRKRQQQDYKAVLIDNLMQKEKQADRVKKQRFAAVDYGLTQAKNL